MHNSALLTDYSLRRWEALGRFLGDGQVSIDNNHVENQMRPWAMGRKAWLFCGSELAGQRAAMVMSLVQSAKLNGHDPWAYLKDVLERLLAHPNNRIEELLPHRWSRPPDASRWGDWPLTVDLLRWPLLHRTRARNSQGQPVARPSWPLWCA